MPNTDWTGLFMLIAYTDVENQYSVPFNLRQELLLVTQQCSSLAIKYSKLGVGVGDDQ